MRRTAPRMPQVVRQRDGTTNSPGEELQTGNQQPRRLKNTEPRNSQRQAVPDTRPPVLMGGLTSASATAIAIRRWASIGSQATHKQIGNLWVPKTYATRRYSWMTPPARSRRHTRN
jgi:hypothetical protein